MPETPTVRSPAGREKPPGRRKAGRPRDFPLRLHASGQFCKNVRGRTYYFGADAKAALARWVTEGPSLLAGRARPGQADRLTCRDLVNRFLTAKLEAMNAGELSRASFTEYHGSLGRFLAAIGPDAVVVNLGPSDFEKVRRKLGEGVGVVTLGKRLQCVRTALRWSWESELIAQPVRTGPAMRTPRASDIRKARAKSGSREYTRVELLALLDAAVDGWIRAALLLAINCGLGNGDLSALERRHISGDWLDFPRPKTGSPRRAFLWVETRQALAAAALARPEPADPVDAGAVFLTRNGLRLTRCSASKGDDTKSVFHDALRSAFEVVATNAGVVVTGRGFYGLRSTYRTVADEVADPPAIALTMGHATSVTDVRSQYVRRISDDRIRAVAEHVHRWLFGAVEGGAE